MFVYLHIHIYIFVLSLSSATNSQLGVYSCVRGIVNEGVARGEWGRQSATSAVFCLRGIRCAASGAFTLLGFRYAAAIAICRPKGAGFCSLDSDVGNRV